MIVADEAAAADAGGARRLGLTALIFAAIMLNYVDRQMLALLKPTLSTEFHWSNRDFAHLGSGFQFAAAFAFLGVGVFLDRVGLKRGFAVGVAGWSLAAAAHAVVSGVGGFFAARAVLGAFEATGTPAAVKSAATYFGPRDRALLLGLGNMAPNIGAVVAPLTIPALALAVGWRGAFLVVGALGLVWVAAWLAFRHPAPVAATTPGGERVSPWALLRTRAQWALIVAKALSDQVWFFLLLFLPDFFNRQFGIAQGTIGLPVALVYALAALGALSGGVLPRVLIARGLGADAVRKLPMLAYALMVLVIPAALYVESAWTAAVVLGVGLFAHQGFSTSVFALATDLFPAGRIGTAVGLAAFAGNMASVGMQEFAGWSLDAGHGYAPMFFACAGSYLLATLAVQLIVPRIGRAMVA